MIAKMLKTYVVARAADRERLLEALRDLGVLHLAPMDPAKAVAADETLAAIDRLRRAGQALGSVGPTGEKPDLSADQAAAEVLAIQRRAAERRGRLAAIHQQIQQLAPWGDVTLDQLQALREAGVEVRFYAVATDALGELSAECAQAVGELPGERALVAVVNRSAEPKLPDGAEPVELPSRDRPALRAEAAEIDEAFQADECRLAELARCADDIEARRLDLEDQAEMTAAARGGLKDETLYAVQGWIPAEQTGELAGPLAEAGIQAGVRTLEPAEDETPPTLVRYPRWVRPIKGLFDILGTVPGYDEFDLSPFFMVALPIFAAMIIGDAGYGLIFLALPLLLYRKMLSAAGRAKTHLVIVVGAVTVLWGVLTANYFGVTPTDLMAWGGFSSIDALRGGSGLLAATGNTMVSLGVLWDVDPDTARFVLIKVSFFLGTIHLVLAHLRQALGYAPNSKALSEIGWCLVLLAMLAIVWKLFSLSLPAFAVPNWLVLSALVVLAVGYVLAILFACPQYTWGKRIGVGFASSLLPLIGTFGDTMSYIRLMAVGLASYYIAAAFNGLGAMVASGHAALWIVGVPIIVIGHTLNIGLALIAIFAHGVRLNMLEFSTNAGVQWAGYPYEPFAKKQIKES